MSSVPPRDPSDPPSTPGYVLDATGLRLYDGTRNDYMQDGDLGVTMHLDAVSGDAQFRGIVRASQIEGHQGGRDGTGARMWLDFTAGDPVVAPAGATPGVSPYWAIADNNGVVRVEAGLLAALGNSPLQWGMRVNDSNHSPIFDSMGLIATMTLVAQLNGVAGSTNTVSPYVPIAVTSFTTSRVQNLFVLGILQMENTGTLGTPIHARLNLDGQLSNDLKSRDTGVGGGFATAGGIFMMTAFLAALNLPAGSHNLSVEAAVENSAAVCNIHDGTVNAYLMGG